MVDFQDFTIDAKRYPLQEFADFLNKNGLKYIPIIDAGIAVGDNVAFNEGVKRDLFIKSTAEKGYLYGIVWPGRVHYVDFFNPNATKYWGEMLDMLYQQIKFNGVWLDMNEASNFCDGECPPPAGTRYLIRHQNYLKIFKVCSIIKLYGLLCFPLQV